LDYVAKPYDAPVLAQRIREIVEARRAPKAAAPEPRMRSAAMLALGERLTRLASTNVSLLLVGETGSGKRQIGRTFHQLSARNREPFIEIRCGALAGADADRILFGETLARQEHGERTSISGALEKAGAGTLFLHHIEEMPPAVQTKLIQVIDEKKFHRVGDFANDIPFGARLISSSDLASAELKKKISPDLVYRLAVVELRTPPLRNRQEDIELLIHDLLRECAAELGVHELRSRLLRALTLGSGKKIVTADMFPEFEAGEDAKPAIVHLDEARAAAEREQILRTLAASSGRIGEAASRLGISRVTLWTKMKRLGLHQGGEEASPAAEQ
jgi:DNA-binding NtrC family response regulator